MHGTSIRLTLIHALSLIPPPPQDICSHERLPATPRSQAIDCIALHFRADADCSQEHGPNATAQSPTHAINARVEPGLRALPLGQAVRREAYRPFARQYDIAAECGARYSVAQVWKGGELG